MGVYFGCSSIACMRILALTVDVALRSASAAASAERDSAVCHVAQRTFGARQAVRMRLKK